MLAKRQKDEGDLLLESFQQTQGTIKDGQSVHGSTVDRGHRRRRGTAAHRRRTSGTVLRCSKPRRGCSGSTGRRRRSHLDGRVGSTGSGKRWSSTGSGGGTSAASGEVLGRQSGVGTGGDGAARHGRRRRLVGVVRGGGVARVLELVVAAAMAAAAAAR
ncbi:hypothetical protein EJB05_02431 [Eragrostis curvula]|uniref:Uncharacterized protein n=1 Tax=Eragrostis curvula TaxID=38414 RepID=A0A5J9WSX1_9POAL|nr:hypothetical protein EJB05_02431 [Eragrostis curvula]